MSTTYAVVPAASVPDDSPLWTGAAQRPDTARRSLDGTLVLISWVDVPDLPAGSEVLPDLAAVQTLASSPAWDGVAAMAALLVSGTVAELTAGLATGDYDGYLDRVMEAEIADKNRVSGRAAIQDRMDDTGW